MQLFYRHFGKGQPLIILHGLFGQSDNWVTIGRRLSERFSVYIPDLRNHGRSPHDAIHSYPAMVDDLAGFLETCRIEKPVLVGHSMGGKTAMAFAFRYPEKVAALAVIDISPRQYPESPEVKKVISEMQQIVPEQFRTLREIEKYLQQRVADPQVRMIALKNLCYETPGKPAWRLNLEAISHNLGQIFESVETDRTYNGPALFVRGGKSGYVVDEDIPLIKRYFPSALIKTIPGATHWIHADAPEELVNVLNGFLA